MTMKLKTIYLGLIYVFVFLAAVATAEPPAGYPWKLVWGDEFNGKSLDETKWVIRLDNGINTHRKPEAVLLDGKGNLVLRGWQDETGQCYSGAVTSYRYFRHRYGYYEIRCILPQEIGHWPAFWFQTDLQSSPPYRADVVGAEIDVFEYLKQESCTIEQNVHWGTGTKCYEHMGHELKFPELAKRGYHTYGLLWTPKAYVFYIDGKPIWRTSRGISNFELYINLTEDMEPRNYKGVVPDDYRFKEDHYIIDYLRVYDIEDPLPPPSDKKGKFIQMVELFTDEANAKLLRDSIWENFPQVLHSPATTYRAFPLIDFKADGSLPDLAFRDNKPVEFASPDDLPCETMDRIYGSFEYLNIEGRDLTPVLYLRADMTRRAGEEINSAGQKKPIMHYKRGLTNRHLLNPNTWYILSDTDDMVEVKGKPEKKVSLVIYRLFTDGKPLAKPATAPASQR